MHKNHDATKPSTDLDKPGIDGRSSPRTTGKLAAATVNKLVLCLLVGAAAMSVRPPRSKRLPW